MITPLQAQGLIIIGIVLLAIIAFVFLTRKKRRIKQQMEAENELGTKGVEFKTMDAFIQHLPEYCIKDDITSQFTRKTMETLGAKFQQRVFIDTEGGDDTTCWMRKHGSNMFVHDKGFYFDPRFYTKKIVYYYKNDSRPVVDMANDGAWINSDMSSRFLFAAVNTADMNARKGWNEKMILYIITAIGIGVLIAIIMSYNGAKQEQEHYEALYRFINQTRRI